MQAIIYAAKSTADERGSIPTQLEDARELCERDGLTVAAEYKDEAKSAYHGSRGHGLARAKEHAEQLAAEHGECALVVQHTDRLARGDAIHAAHLIEIVLWARKASVTIRSVQDDSTSENLVMSVVIGERNYEDSKRKSAAVKAGLRRSAERGNWHGGPVPDGYKLGPPVEKGGRGLVIDEDRAPTIRRIFALAGDGVSRSAVARQLNAEGLTTQKGLPWTSEAVGDKLSNPVYKGVLALNRRYPDEQRIPGNWPPIIDPADFDRLAAPATRRSHEPKGRPTQQHLLSGIARCGVCGRPMYSRTSPYVRKDGSRTRRYTCVNKKGKGGTCSAPPIDGAMLDAAVRDHLLSRFIDFEQWVKDQAAANEAARDALADRLGVARRFLRTRQRERDTALTRYTEKQTDLREEVLQVTRERVAQAERRVAEAEAALGAASVENFTDVMLDAYNELKRQLQADSGPLNDRLRQVWSAVRVTTEDNGLIRVVPSIRPEIAAELEAGGGYTEITEDERETLERQIPAAIGEPDPADQPVRLLVSPPPRSLVVKNGDVAWLKQSSRSSARSRCRWTRSRISRLARATCATSSAWSSVRRAPAPAGGATRAAGVRG